jgi:osmoprotectant transport system permease protein
MNYLVNHIGLIGMLFGQHLLLTLTALLFSLIIALPTGILINRYAWLQGPILSVLGIIYTIPSLSLFVLLIPLFGLGFVPATIGLVAYAQLLLVRNWVVGLNSLDPAMIEAARGMGMNSWQRFIQIEFPLALPMLLAGIRLAVLSSIGIGTIAAYINAGGLGLLLFEGVVTANYEKIFAGSLAVTILAIGMNYILRFFEYRAEVAIHGHVE